MRSELKEKFMVLQYLHRKLHIRKRSERPTNDANRGQGRILALLKMHDGVSVKDLSYLLGVGVSTISELLSKLEKNGYIAREQSDSDKRMTIIKLTEKGKNEEQTDTSEKSDLFSVLNETEQAAFGKMLDKIIDGLEKKLGYDGEEAAAQMHEERRRMREMMEHFRGHGFHGFHGGQCCHNEMNGEKCGRRKRGCGEK
jgi:DNA-binding MarR family transcriptional regulator